MIIIFSVEGSESNTECNFFVGMSYHFIRCKFGIIGFKKIVNKKKSCQDIVGRLKEFLRQFPDDIKDAKYFFIGDGDKESDFPSMENTRNVIFNYLKNKLKINLRHIEDNILMDKPHKFEDSYRKMLNNGIKFPSKAKRKTNLDIFNIYATKVGWFNNDNNELNFKKIINDMTKTKNPHLRIVKELIKQENDK